jgi:hypothetical protein
LQIDPIPVTYAELLPRLLRKNLVQLRAPLPVPEKLPAWYKPDQPCVFHQGIPGHSIENCYAMKNVVQRLINGKNITFTDSTPNVQTNPFLNHGAAAVIMVEDCQKTYLILDIQCIRMPLVPLHAKLLEVNLFDHYHDVYEACLLNPWGCQKVKDDIQGLLDRGELVVERKCNDVCVITPEEPLEIFYESQKSVVAPLVICLPGPMPYASEKAIPYKYNATMIKDGREVAIPPLPSVGNVLKTVEC